MKKLLLLLFLPLMIWAQTTTHIHDTLLNPNDTVTSGSTVTGTLTLISNAWDVNGRYVVKTLSPITITNGVIDVNLAPNDTSTNNNSYYTVNYSIKQVGNPRVTTNYSEKWQVPTSTDTLTVSQVLLNTTTNPAINPILVSQIVPSDTDGDCLITNTVGGVKKATWSSSCGSSGGSAPGGTDGQLQYRLNSFTFGGFTPQVNGTGITTPSGLNFLNSSATNGLTLSFTNPSAGGIKLGLSGTLDNAGLTHDNFGITYPSWLTGPSSVALGGSLGISGATGQVSHKFVGTCNASTSVDLCSLVASDIPALSYQSPLGFTPENVSNKSTVTTLGTSDTLYPTQNAVKTYVDSGLSGKEPAITIGTSSQYFRGDKTFQALLCSVVTNCADTSGSYPNPTWITSLAWAKLTGVPSTFAPSAHATTHQFGGSDPIGTETPSANAIPQADSGGKLDSGWFKVVYQNSEITAPGSCTTSIGCLYFDSGTHTPTFFENGSINRFVAVISKNAAGIHQWLSYIDASGTQNLSQPAFSDLSGVASRAQGGLNSSSAGVGFLRDGATPTAGELSGDCTTSASFVINCTKTGGVSFANSATVDTTNAGNITTGTLPNSRIVALPHANIASTTVTPGSYTNANITVAADGSITSASNGTGGGGGGTGNAGEVVTPTTGASMTFSPTSSTAGTSVVFVPTATLGANVTSATCSGFTPGQTAVFVFTQDATGGRTVAPCSGWDSFSISKTASATTTQIFAIDASGHGHTPGTTDTPFLLQMAPERAAPTISLSAPSGFGAFWFDSTNHAPTFATNNGSTNFIAPLIKSSATSHQWITNISADGTQHTSQPAFTDISGNATAAQMATSIRAGGFSVMFLGSYAAAGTTMYLTIPYACTITDWVITGDSTATIKIWRIADGGTALPTVTNTISTSGFSLSTGTRIHSTTLSDLSSTALAAYDTLGINLSASASTHVEFTLGCQR